MRYKIFKILSNNTLEEDDRLWEIEGLEEAIKEIKERGEYEQAYTILPIIYPNKPDWL